MRVINVLLSIVVSLVLALLVFEGGLRLIGFGPPDTLNRPDDRLGWSKEPGKVVTRSTAEYDVELAINELGLRDDSMSNPAKSEGTFRVLMLGDSFTLGYSVARENLFVDQLERWWQAENRRVDVINAGTEGYSTDQQVAWLLANGDAYAPDLVLLFPYENDLYWNGQPAYVGDKAKPLFDANGALTTGTLPPPPEKHWTEKFATTRLFNRGGQDVSQHIFTPEGGTRPLLKEWGAVLTSQPDFMADAIDRTRGALTALERKCDDLGAACFVVPIPSHSAVDPEYRAKFGEKTLGLPADRWDPDRPVNSFLTLASEVGLESLNPSETLRALTRNGSDVFYKVDWHLNALGNAELASFLHDKLDSDALAVFPPTHRPGQVVAELPGHVAKAETPFWPKLFGILWVALTVLYYVNYRDEPMWQPPLKVALLLAAIFSIFLGVRAGVNSLPPAAGQAVLMLFVLTIVGFIVFKLGRRVATILELIKSFVLRGHWYLLPLVVVLLTVGSLLVVAASSPLIAPFIYTLF